MDSESPFLFLLTYTLEGEDSEAYYTKQIYASNEQQALERANKWLKVRPGCTYLSLEKQAIEPPMNKPALPHLKEVIEQFMLDIEPKITVYLYVMSIEDPFGIIIPHPFYAPDLETAWARANAFYDKVQSINQKYRKVERSMVEFKIGDFTYQPEMEILLSTWKSLNIS